MNAFDLGCAVLAASAYREGVREENRIAPIAGAVQLDGALGYVSDPASGFEASAFTYHGRIVIAFAGTNPDQDPDLVTNGLLALGFGSARQLALAAEFYQRIKQTYGGDTVTFTGHSLGGGLAALMGVFFNKPAVTFDPAPFRLTATQTTAQTLRNYLYSPQSTGVFPSREAFAVDTDLAGFTNSEELLANANPALYASVAAIAPVAGLLTYPTNLRGEAGITAHAVRGEFLSAGFLTLGPTQLNDLRLRNSATPEFIEINPIGANLGPYDLHSINLLVAAAREPRLEAFFNNHSQLTQSLFDKVLYARLSSATETDLLARLVQHEFGDAGSPGGTGHLSRFADDLGRFIALSDGMAGQASVQRGLTAATFEYYYFNTPTAATQLFTTEGGGIHFKFSDIGAPNSKARPRLVNAVNAYLSPDELRALGAVTDTTQLRGEIGTGLLMRQDAWHIQSGTAGMVWTGASSDQDAAIGSAGTDVLDGGAGDDILIGGAGRDFLNGGADHDILIGGLDIDVLEGGVGNDRLLGGAGVDIYRFSGLWGNDTIEDSGTDGVLEITGVGNIDGAGAKRTSPTSTTWRTDDGQVTYTLVNLGTPAAPRQNLVITVAAGAHAGTITVRNWSEGQLGINLGTEVLAPVTTDTYVGEYAKATNPEGTAYELAPDGNYLAGAAQADAPDVLNGSAAADWLQGAGGNDGLAGNAGDDLIEGGAGDDLLLGGWGADTINGGAGNDFIFGSALGSIAQPTVVGFTPPASIGVELARGFSWVAYRNPGERFEGDTAVLRTPQVAGASLFNAVFENGQYVVEASGNLIDGGAGNDYISAGTGADVVRGGDDDDDIVGLDGADVLFGDAGDDFIWGDGTSDPARASSDHTYVPASQHGNDLLVGGAGNDVLVGQGGADELYGGTRKCKSWTFVPLTLRSRSRRDGHVPQTEARGRPCVTYEVTCGRRDRSLIDCRG